MTAIWRATHGEYSLGLGQFGGKAHQFHLLGPLHYVGRHTLHQTLPRFLCLSLFLHLFSPFFILLHLRSC
jgi:hypothetical protein